jgi:hypothetical protein
MQQRFANSLKQPTTLRKLKAKDLRIPKKSKDSLFLSCGTRLKTAYETNVMQSR